MWFGAKLLFESSNRHEGNRVLQEESIRLLQADNEEQAHSKAGQLGISEQHEYQNEQGETVAWRFVALLEVQDLCERDVYDGMEVFSTMKWNTAENSIKDTPNP
jgi:hypothetical protein